MAEQVQWQEYLRKHPIDQPRVGGYHVVFNERNVLERSPILTHLLDGYDKPLHITNREQRELFSPELALPGASDEHTIDIVLTREDNLTHGYVTTDFHPLTVPLWLAAMYRQLNSFRFSDEEIVDLIITQATEMHTPKGCLDYLATKMPHKKTLLAQEVRKQEAALNTQLLTWYGILGRTTAEAFTKHWEGNLPFVMLTDMYGWESEPLVDNDFSLLGSFPITTTEDLDKKLSLPLHHHLLGEYANTRFPTVPIDLL